MTLEDLTALQALQNAQAAFQRGDRRTARRWAETASRLDPTLEDAWLLQAALATPRASLLFLERALQANPASERARKGRQWALNRLRDEEAARKASQPNIPTPPQPQPAPVEAAAHSLPAITPRKPVHRSAGFSSGLVIFACLLVAAFIWMDTLPARAFINSLSGPRQAGSVDWAPAVVAKAAKTPFPTLTPLPSATASLLVATLPTATAAAIQPAASPSEPAPQPTEPPAILPTVPAPTQPPATLPSALPTDIPAASPTPSPENPAEPSPTPLATDDPLLPSPTPLPTDTPAPSSAPVQSAPNYNGGKLILVDISQQHLYAYEGSTLVYSFVASTGMNNATRVGTFSILDKIPSAYGSTWNIWMPNWMGIYYAGSLENGIHALPILPNGQLLWAGYLGTPISYGCVVLGTYESELLYNWADIGTPVVIQY